MIFGSLLSDSDTLYLKAIVISYRIFSLKKLFNIGMYVDLSYTPILMYRVVITLGNSYQI